MRAIGFGASIMAAFAVEAFLPVIVEAGDVAKAKRALMWAKDTAQSEKWNDFDTNMKKAAAEMNGLSDAEKAPLLAEIAAIKAMVTKSVEDDVNKRLDRAAKADPGMGKMDLQRAEMRLKSDEAVNYADAAAIEKLKARLAGMTGAPVTNTPPVTTTPPVTDTADGDVAGEACEQHAGAGRSGDCCIGGSAGDSTGDEGSGSGACAGDGGAGEAE